MRALLLPAQRLSSALREADQADAISSAEEAQPRGAELDPMRGSGVEHESGGPAASFETSDGYTDVAVSLAPVPLAGNGAEHDEAWLQALLYDHPELIPMDRIEAGAGAVLPLCRELPIARTGGLVFLDMLGVTRTGRLVLVECKLWRNPQARREVVAQVIEYAGLMRGWSYGDLTAKLKQCNGWTGPNPIFEQARKIWPDLEEAALVDRVTRSLDNADFHLIIAGDGIRSDVQVLARQINDAGSKARLALLEIQIWRAASGETVVLPWLPVKTELIEQRVVVAADDGRQLTMSEVRVDNPNAGRNQERDRAGDADVEKLLNPERAASAERMRQFWSRFIEQVRFDHPEQTPPTHGGPNWVKLALSGGQRLSIYRQNSEETMGMYMPLNLKKDEDLIAMLEAELDGMQQESGLELRISPRTSDLTARDLSVSASTHGLSDEEQLAWLSDTANRMVTLLRPKLSAWEREAQNSQHVAAIA